MKHPPHPKNLSSDDGAAVSSSEAVIPMTSSMASSSQSHRVLPIEKPSVAVEDHSRDAGVAASCVFASTTASESVVVERRSDYSALCKWTIANFPRIKSRALWSKYFEVGGFDCRLLIYPKGDSQALPGYLSIYLQIMDPRNTASSKWDCFASYRLAIENPSDSSKSVHRDSWHRFSSKKKSHGWCDFASLNSLLDPKLGFLHSSNDCILITADILILHESFSFSRDNYDLQSNNVSIVGGGGIMGQVGGDVLSGKFTWRVHNFSLFKEMIKAQKIMSPVFPAGECNLRISVYQSAVNGIEYLSMCLESKDTEKNALMSDKSCWCLFRMSVLNQKPGGGSNHIHRDSYGRFVADNKGGNNTSLRWNDYMKMADFVGPESGFLVDDTAVFSTSFHVIKELSSFSKSGTLIEGRNGGNSRKFDGNMGKFTWRIENFTRLKDLLKKRKITGLCVKSRSFQIGNRDCRLIIYPREMVESMKMVAKLDVELSVEERNLLSVGYKNVIGARRASWRIMSSIEQKEELKGNDNNVKLIKGYRHKVEEELSKICYDIMSIIDKHLVPSSGSGEATVFYYKMKGDYFRYLAEFKTDQERKEAADLSLKGYESASATANTDLPSTHPIRLGLALNFSVFYYEIMNSPERACHLAKQAFDEAMRQLLSWIL